MFLRLLFLLLLALNLGVAAWLLFGVSPQQPLPATDPGVPELRLLSEQGASEESQAAELSQAPARRAAQPGDRCFSLGPFPTQADLRQAMDALTPHVQRIQFRQEETTASRGWWVYLPALPTRDAALTMARRLSDKGVRDYYVVTAGDRENTISLGLFHDADNARRRRAQMAALGFTPQLSERVESLPVYYIDYALTTRRSIDWRSDVSASGIQQSSIRCF